MPISNEDLENWFTYHAPREDQLPRYETIRNAAKHFCRTLLANTPACPDQTVAIRKVREAVMTANASIACSDEPPSLSLRERAREKETDFDPQPGGK